MYISVIPFLSDVKAIFPNPPPIGVNVNVIAGSDIKVGGDVSAEEMIFFCVGEGLTTDGKLEISVI